MDSQLLNWPSHMDRTVPDKREDISKFSTTFRATKKDLKREMDRLGVDEWRLDDVTGSGGDPGIVVRWRKDDVDYVLACDGYTDKRDNLREAYLWVKETRKRADRKVKTGQDEFAAARLPGGDEDAVAVADKAAHEILGVDPDATDEEVRDAFRERVKEVHPDNGGDQQAFQRAKHARDQMMEDSA